MRFVQHSVKMILHTMCEVVVLVLLSSCLDESFVFIRVRHARHYGLIFEFLLLDFDFRRRCLTRPFHHLLVHLPDLLEAGVTLLILLIEERLLLACSHLVLGFYRSCCRWA